MSQISAVLVMIAGLATLLTSTVFIRDGDTQLFVSFVGLVVAAIGLGVWGMLILSSLADTSTPESPTRNDSTS